jgi:hypothetical protein
MSLLCNLTSYGAATVPSITREGRDVTVAITAGRYHLPKPGDLPDAPLAIADEQREPPLGDVYAGAPQTSGLVVEGQAAYFRPATDISVIGHARAPHDKPVTRLIVRVSVGPCAHQAVVFGDRIWESRLGLRDVAMSQPQPFIAMPLVWERAFGGSVYDVDRLVANEPRNPVGRGFFRNCDSAGQPLPNIEDPRNLIQGPDDRPVPIGFAPVARWWQPRASYAGTYDDVWIRERAPVWPADFDERFFCSAPAALQAIPHLRGGEVVYLEGLHCNGPMRFRLPAPRMVVRFRFNAREVRRAMTMDAVVIEPDSGHLTLIHRASAPAAPTITAHRETVIREIEAWEDLVA